MTGVGVFAPPDADAREPEPAAEARRRVRGQWVVIAAVVLALLVGIAAWLAIRHVSHSAVDKSAAARIADQRSRAAIDALKNEPANGVGIYASVRPGLVVIQSDSGSGRTAESGLGSGVVINKDGDILTAFHVVDGAKSIKVSFADGTESAASVKSSDGDHDIAVLAPAHLPQVLAPAVLGGGARVGDETFAIGNPLGLVGSLSAGVISGVDRSFSLPDGRRVSGLIQFDAAVNPGSSGGPLLNRNGQVIGIVTALANTGGDRNFAGIGFAVPIATAGRAAGAPAQ